MQHSLTTDDQQDDPDQSDSKLVPDLYGLDEAVDSDDIFTVIRTHDPAWATPQPAHDLFLSTDDPSSGTAEHDHNDSLYGKTPILEISSHDLDGPRLRLLELDPARAGQPIHGRLIVRPVFDSPPYIALSCSSSQELPCVKISIGGTLFSVSLHLWHALDRLRSDSKTVIVWVDAICINQRNQLDKSAQVNIISQIYNSAQEVRIWLGLGSELSHYDLSDPELYLMLCRTPDPWWQRLWAIQECAYAKGCPLVMLGPHTTSLADFHQYMASAASHYDRSAGQAWHTLLAYHVRFVRDLHNACQAQNQQIIHRWPLLHRLEETVGWHYSKPHDRIYALLNLVVEGEAQQIKVNYAKPFEELQREVIDLLTISNGDNADHYRDLTSPKHSSPEQRQRQAFASWNHSTASVMEEASEQDRLDIIQEVLRLTAIVDTRCFGRSVCIAASEGHIESLRLLLESGADPNVPMDIDQTIVPPSILGIAPADPALVTAVRYGSIETVKLLLDHGADVDAQGNYGTALETACYRGLEDMVRLLLDRGANTNALGVAGTALFSAAEQGRGGIVQLLLSQGADVNRMLGPTRVWRPGEPHFVSHTSGAELSGPEILHGNQVEAARLRDETFRQYRSQTHGIGDGRQGMFLQGAASSAIQNADSLLGSDTYRTVVEAANNTLHTVLNNTALRPVSSVGGYSTPLQAAASKGHEDIVRILLDHGADLTLMGRFDEGTALYAAQAAEHTSVTRLLLAKCITELPLQSLRDALGGALDEGHLELVTLFVERVHLLLDHESDGEHIVNELETLLDAAICTGSYALVQLILEEDTLPRLPHKSLTPLVRIAFKENQVDIFAILLENRRSSWQTRPSKAFYYGDILCASAKAGHIEVVRLLTAPGHLNGAHSGDHTIALLHAVGRKDAEMAGLLLGAGVDILVEYRSRPCALALALELDDEHLIAVLLKLDRRLPEKPLQDILEPARSQLKTAYHFGDIGDQPRSTQSERQPARTEGQTIGVERLKTRALAQLVLELRQQWVYKDAADLTKKTTTDTPVEMTIETTTKDNTGTTLPTS